MKPIRKIHGLSWPFWALSLVALLVVAGLALLPWGIAAGQSGSPTPGNANADQNMIQGIQQALSSNRLSDEDRQALQKKLEYSERMQAQRAGQPGIHRPKGTLVPPVSMPRPQALSGADSEERIIQGSEGIVHSWEASINNLWQGMYNGVPYQVLAGASTDDAAQGLVIVMEYPSDQGLPTRHTYLSPAPSGSLRILERQAGRLQLAAADGTTLFFDLETRTFQP